MKVSRERKGQAFAFKSSFPEAMEQRDVFAKFADAMQSLQQLERNNIGRDSVVTQVAPGINSVNILCVGDFHIGSIATDMEAVLRIRDYILKTPDTGVVLLGDEVEGMIQKYLNTNAARTPIDFQQQIDILREGFLKPLAKRGKVLAMVGGYWGHPGWAEDATTLNTWRLMTEGTEIPVIRNGGKLEVGFDDGSKHVLQIWHNPPGKSEHDPVFGLRKAAVPQGESIRPDGFASAHIHRMAVGVELLPGSNSKMYFISSGTAKGSNPIIPPDRFGVKLGLSLADPLNGGQGVVVQKSDRRYPYASNGQGDLAHSAIMLLNKTESSGMTDEIKERIYVEVENQPIIKLVDDASRVAERAYGVPDDYKNGDGENRLGKELLPLYTELTFDIQTRMPIVLHMIANTRIGSVSSGLDALTQYQKELIVSNPHALAIYLRSMIDHEVAAKPERMDILDQYVELISAVGDKAIALLLSSEFRIAKWKQTLGDEDRQQPIPPASYVSDQTQVPMIHHLSQINFQIGQGTVGDRKIVYPGVFTDKLNGHGSKAKATFGLRRIYDLYLNEKPGFVAGGHMPMAGTMTFFDRSNRFTQNPVLIAPGWWARYVDTIGKGGVSPGAKPGQALIMMPGKNQSDYLAFPTSNADETGYMHEALLLWQGARILGIEKKLLKLSGR